MLEQDQKVKFIKLLPHFPNKIAIECPTLQKLFYLKNLKVLIAKRIGTYNQERSMKSQILEFKIPTCTFIQACMFILLEKISHLYVYYHLYVYSVL